MMRYPKQAGQDVDAHRRLAMENLRLLDEVERLKAYLKDARTGNIRRGDDIERLNDKIKQTNLVNNRMLDHADDLIADWQSGNIQTKDMAVRLHAFVEDVRAAAKEQQDGS